MVLEIKNHLFRHAAANDHGNAIYNDSKIIESDFKSNASKRRFAESLLIKELRPTGNVQGKSVELKLFNHLP